MSFSKAVNLVLTPNTVPWTYTQDGYLTSLYNANTLYLSTGTNGLIGTVTPMNKWNIVSNDYGYAIASTGGSSGVTVPQCITVNSSNSLFLGQCLSANDPSDRFAFINYREL